MQVAQVILHPAEEIAGALSSLQAIRPNLVLAFGSSGMLVSVTPWLAAFFPEARRLGCSTAGEISLAGVSDDSCVLTAVRLDQTTLVEVSTTLADMADSLAAGQRLGLALPKDGLRGVLLFAQGVHINASALLAGISGVLGQVPIAGGLAGDGGAFRQTWVLDERGLGADTLVALGMYGERLRFCHGSFGGWATFGPARKVTRCVGNILYELDGQPALDVYKRYLGEYAKDLPASGLFFPFAMLSKNHDELGLIRTTQAVDERNGSLSLAGEIDPEGYLKLMHASTDALVNGAEGAAQAARNMLGDLPPANGLLLLVSCFGRRLVMGDCVDEEVEAVVSVFGQQTMRAGFYSYGEISPFAPGAECKFHNQTMTVSYFDEG
jgi:hypothetical protein